jgi:hypothetical protein
MTVAYVSATIEKWNKTRPNEGADRMIPMILERSPETRVMMQIAFEAGRQWQHDHPTAELDWPDYDAPKKVE